MCYINQLFTYLLTMSVIGFPTMLVTQTKLQTKVSKTNTSLAISAAT